MQYGLSVPQYCLDHRSAGNSFCPDSMALLTVVPKCRLEDTSVVIPDVPEYRLDDTSVVYFSCVPSVTLSSAG